MDLFQHIEFMQNLYKNKAIFPYHGNKGLWNYDEGTDYDQDDFNTFQYRVDGIWLKKCNGCNIFYSHSCNFKQCTKCKSKILFGNWPQKEASSPLLPIPVPSLSQ